MRKASASAAVEGVQIGFAEAGALTATNNVAVIRALTGRAIIFLTVVS
jgi:hypothetical protein